MADDLLDDLLRDSDDEGHPPAMAPQPKPTALANLTYSPLEKANNPKKPGHLGMLKIVKDSTENTFCDPFFGIRVRSGVVDMDALTMLSKDIQKIGILSKNIGNASSWMSIAVIVEKSGIVKSSTGKEYICLTLHDLKNCEQKGRRTLLFGDAVKEHWKLQKGAVIALLSPQLMTDNKTAEPTIKVSKSSCIVHVGSSTDLGTCKGRKQDSSQCNAFVNQSKCDMCVYHAAGEVRKLAARRGTFSQSILIPNKKDIVIPRSTFQSKPVTIMCAPSISKSKQEVMNGEKEALASIITRKTSSSLGARCLASISSDKSEGGEKRNIHEATSFKQFVNLNAIKEMKKANERTTKEEDAIKRALHVLEESKRKNRDGENKLKRKRVDDQEEKDKKNKEETSEMTGRNRVLALLAKRSRHANEADGIENEMVMNHLNDLEKREAVERVTTERTQLTEVKVFSCSFCKYTARHRSDYCMKQGHPVKSHLATKRFFKCKDCSYSTSTYSLLPTRRCQECKGDNWDRVSMMRERKVVLETEKLQLRGEERTFIN